MKFAFLRPFLGPFLRQKESSPPPFQEVAAPASAPERLSSVLTDVLGQEQAAGSAGAPAQDEFDPSPSPDKLNVGAGLAEAKRSALDAAERLMALADADTARVIASLARQLDAQTCRVAFVGQVKAGKSSLVNVLVEQLDFLPADINPCTAVITRLNFGVPGRPQSGALFTFFSHEEWRRFSLGGRTRELTDRLFPDFNWQVFESYVKAIEERAREKHGAALEDLLGREHYYEEVRVDTLRRYVGAEHPDPETAEEGAEGEFSDITKSADIFLDLGAFSFPTIVIDTPGVNDPFLVRDEITRQSLEAADICVVVVTARQPLSAADLNLLRTLRGLEKDRLIIFLNKIDELNGGAEVLHEIRRRVSATLKQEFPSAHIPLIFGSAELARKALSRHVAGPLSEDGSALPADDWEAAILQLPSEDEIAEIVEAEASYSKSGLLPLSKAISDMINAGPAGDMIRMATRLIEAVSRNLIVWLEIKADLLHGVTLDPRQAEGELDAVAKLRRELAAKFDAFSAKLDALHDEKVRFIKQKLASAVDAYIPAALAASTDDAAAQAGRLDVRLRMRLETVFLDAVEDVRNSLMTEQEALKSELSRLLDASRLRGEPAIILGQPLVFSPSLVALSEPAALGFAAHLARFAGTPAYGEEGSASLRDLVVADFAPIIEELAREASRVFQEGVASFANQAQCLTFGPMDMVIKDASRALEETLTASPEVVEKAIQGTRQTVSDLKFILEVQ